MPKSTPAAPRSRADRFRVARCETAQPGSAQCHALVAAAKVPMASPSGENPLRLPNAETDKITDVVNHRRRYEDEAIEAIQQSAVPRDELGGVFETKITF